MCDISSRREFLRRAGALGALGATGGLAAEARSASKKPNVVLILVDDLGWTDLGCFAGEYYRTDNIDRLCAGGMKFTDAYAACAVCSPTRAAVMTGRYPVRTGVTTWIRPVRARKHMDRKRAPQGYGREVEGDMLCPLNSPWLELEEVTVAEVLKQVGYATCHVGKWHLGPKNRYPDKQGFDYNIGGCELGNPTSYFDPYRNAIPTLESRKRGEYLTDREASEAADFIRRHKDRPFFLYVAHYAVHWPLQGRADLVDKYKSLKPAGRHRHPVYAAMVESVDRATGTIMGALEDAGVADNTIVIFTSDNGGVTSRGTTSNAPLRAGKCWPYEGGIRVPAIIRWPGVAKPGAACDEPIISMDYFPTICSAAGARPPKGVTIDGLDLAPLLGGGGSLKRDALYWHFPHYQKATPYSAVRAGDWKLIRWHQHRRIELYNLAEDVGEENDLSKKMPSKAKQLDEQLTAWLKKTGAKIPRFAEADGGDRTRA